MKLKTIVAMLITLSLLGTALAFDSAEFKIGVVFTGQSFVLQYRVSFNMLNLTSRATIYEYIQNNPGAHFRNICTNLGISIGSVQYHLDQLVESELIESEKDSKYKRFFISKRFTEFEKRLFSFLRKPNDRLIIKYTSDADGCSHKKLAELLDVSSQAITWHVKCLIEEGIVESRGVENSTYYRVTAETHDVLMSLPYRV